MAKEENASPDETKETEDATGAQEEQAPKSGTYTPEQQAHIDKLVGEARKKAREQAKAELETELEQKRQKEADEAETKRLEEEKKFSELIDKQKKTIGELQPQLENLTEKLEAHRQIVIDMLETKVDALGEKAKEAVDNLPGDPDELAKLKWLNANESLFQQAEQPQGNQTRQTRGRVAQAFENTQQKVDRFKNIPIPKI